MKKIFTFIATALIAMAANAQVVFDGTESTGAGFTKGDVAVAFVSDTYTWKADAKTGDDITFEGYFTGAANPKVDGTNYTAGAATPNTGSVILLTPAKSGTLSVYVYVNAGKAIYVLENGTEINFSVNGNAVESGATLEAKGQAAPITFAATAGKTYAVFCAGSKMGYYGYNLIASGGNTLSIDDICGTYKSSYTYKYKTYGDSYWGPYTQSGITITKVNDTQVSINGIGGGYVNITGTFDGSARTITFEAGATVATYYSLYAPVSAGDGVEITEELKPAVATIAEDGTIQVDYDEIYEKYWYYGYKETLTPVPTPKKVWEVTGTLDYLNATDDSKFRSIAATLSKWSDADYEYELTYCDPSNEKASPSTIQFNVNNDEKGSWTLVNGWYPAEDAPTAWYYYPFDDCNSIKIYTGSYSGFSGTQEGGNAYAYYYWYNTKESTNSDMSGFLDFNWGVTEGIQSVTTSSASSTRKYLENGSLVISKNGKKFNAAGALLK